MGLPEDIYREISNLTGDLIAVSLCNYQQFPCIVEIAKGTTEVGFKNMDLCNIALKNKQYSEIYDTLLNAEAYNLLMLDGAMIQLQYRFYRNELIQHRLAFFPSPSLEKFQNEPEIYLEDEIFADIVAKNIIPFPIRFDYDSCASANSPIEHPPSHLTLGQYKNCRIPVSAPLSPYLFIEFILRNFYHTAFVKFVSSLRPNSIFFQQTLHSAERSVIHLMVPSA